jgi:hypothetical protein
MDRSEIREGFEEMRRQEGAPDRISENGKRI